MLSYVKATPFTFRFIFKIKLHRDDRLLLEYLKTQYNIGRVYPYKSYIQIFQVPGKLLIINTC